MEILPGSIVEVYDIETDSFKLATVLRRYGFKSEFIRKHFGEKASRYPDMIDVQFHHNKEISKGHFTNDISS